MAIADTMSSDYLRAELEHSRGTFIPRLRSRPF